MHQVVLAGLGYGCHGETTSNMDRSPQSRHFAKELPNCSLVGKIDTAEKFYVLILSVRKFLRFALLPPRHVTGRTSLNEGPTTADPSAPVPPVTMTWRSGRVTSM